MFELGTPITPNYQFGVDEHYKTHHEDEHIPNLHNPSHAPSHEGHSHNMRGVFLHVMAVRTVATTGTTSDVLTFTSGYIRLCWGNYLDVVDPILRLDRL
jgi:Co/Zn/Cd efflux system component